MSYETVIDAHTAAARLRDPDWVFVDCRFDLRDTGKGEADYRASHVAGAVYAHLDHDLAGPVTAGVTGRHPLPETTALEEALGGLGIGTGTQVIAYDASTGALAAARLWWLLKWAGHDAVAVLDGGLLAWTSQGLPCESGNHARPRASFTARLRPEMALTADQVRSLRDDPAWVLLDARSNERYRGINETIDPVAGHIPGAVSSPYEDSLGADGRFKSPSELAGMLGQRAGGRDAGHMVFYCGSGVTAAHAVLAAAHAGLGAARLYPGSWSEWITDPTRGIAR